jgi:hypothetical protein
VQLHRRRGVARDRTRDRVVNARYTCQVVVGAAHAARREAVFQADLLRDIGERLVEA